MKNSERLSFIRVVAWICLVVTAAAISCALIAGNFLEEGTAIAGMPWGLTLLVDVYIGFIFVSCWIVWREPKISAAIIWVSLILTLGNFVTAIYVLRAAYKSRDNDLRFWMGDYSRIRDV